MRDKLSWENDVGTHQQQQPFDEQKKQKLQKSEAREKNKKNIEWMRALYCDVLCVWCVCMFGSVK